MPKYSIAFHPSSNNFIHKIVEMDSEESAIRFFFKNYVEDGYTSDDEGFAYFSEDFNDTEDPLGSIITI